jgi:hypothetical protein
MHEIVYIFYYWGWDIWFVNYLNDFGLFDVHVLFLESPFYNGHNAELFLD